MSDSANGCVIRARTRVGTTSDSEQLFVTIELRELQNSGAFQSIEHEPLPERYWEASFTHETIDPRKRGANRMTSGGAGSGIDESVTPYGDWTSEQLQRLSELAERWHLNTMRAGCAHQTIEYETDRYGRRVPSLDKTPPCSVNGYRYGHAWLVERLPFDVIDELTSLLIEHSADVTTTGGE